MENSFNQNQVITIKILTSCKIFDENKPLEKEGDIFNSFKQFYHYLIMHEKWVRGLACLGQYFWGKATPHLKHALF